MTIQYSDGRVVEAVLLRRTENTMRVIVQGADDVTEFSEINGTWVSQDCEVVTIEFAWQRLDRRKPISEEDCSCSHELAARLTHLLFTGRHKDQVEIIAPAASEKAFDASHLPI